MFSPKDIEDRINEKKLRFDTDDERILFKNELFNDETISKFIESSFNGNVLHLGPLDEERAEKRWKTI